MTFRKDSNLPDCSWHAGQGAECFASTLFVMGEFGANDFRTFINSNRTVEQSRAYVPTIVDSISRGVEVLYHNTG
jgi:hypothetical protein